MKILITGASSYVGARLYLDLKDIYPVTGTYSSHLLSKDFIKVDITNAEEIRHIINKIKPEIIVHAAAIANARWCAANPDAAKNINQTATQHIVDAANAIHAKIIYISSYAAISPTDLYGQTKKASEDFVKKTKAGYLILRPSFILGYSPNTTNDRPFNRLLRNLEGKPAEYDTSWKFQPTYVGHISGIIDTAIGKNTWNTILHITVPEVKNRYETARDILTPFGIPVTPIDQSVKMPVQKTDVKELSKLGLPEWAYENMISTIIDEIKHKDRFILP